VASETLYPVMPVFLTSIGFSVLWIGLLEGMAEATAGFSKGYFGNLSDHTAKRLLFVRWGYLLSAISKPMMAMTIYPAWIFFSRLTDRVGKGLRTAPRDAILSAEATPLTKGRIFGLHRSMDTMGAVLGPGFALVFLFYYPEHYRELFLLAFIPGVIAVLLTMTLKEKSVYKSKVSVNFFSFLGYWRESPIAYRRLITGLLFFSLINSSDLFLILRAKEAGLTDTSVIAVYIFYNLVYALFAYPAGIIADRIGLFRTLIGGIFLFCFVYAGMAVAGPLYWYALLFFVYGLYAACTESVAKALITNIAGPARVATAVGTYNAFQSITVLLSSSLAGLVWHVAGAQVLFASTSILAFVVMIYFILLLKGDSLSVNS
jgi:MFS family permease